MDKKVVIIAIAAFIIILVVCLAVLIWQFKIYSDSENIGDISTPQTNQNNEIPGSNNPESSPPSILSKEDCGYVTQATIQSLTESIERDKPTTCMSEKIRDCEIGQLTYEGAAGGNDTIFEVSESKVDICVIKLSEKNTNHAVTCDYPKDYIFRIYGRSKEQGTEWTFSFKLYFSINLLTMHEPAGTIKIPTWQDEIVKEVPCTIVR